MSTIKPLDASTIHQICSGQVIVSMSNAVKELIENSLDAGAKSIEIRLKNCGADSLEVIDDGPGIEENEFQTITLKHSTSKIQAYEDLETLSTFGFRGEALNSLCALSNLTITTRHANTQIGHRIEYDNSGAIKNKKQVARSVGTSVLLEKLFFNLPVRYKEFQKNIKKEYNKMLNVVQSYCLISDSIKFSCFHVNATKSTNLMSTNLRNTLKDNIIEIFGIQAFNSMIKFEQSSPSDELKEEYKIKMDENNQNIFKLVGYISNCSHGAGRSAPDRQYFYVNKRPCDNSRVARLINETYHEFNRNQYPMFVLNVHLNSGHVDVNVTPDKLVMFIKNENILCAILKESLRAMYSCSYGNLNFNDTSLSKQRNSNASLIDGKSFFAKNLPDESRLHSTALDSFLTNDSESILLENESIIGDKLNNLITENPSKKCLKVDVNQSKVTEKSSRNEESRESIEKPTKKRAIMTSSDESEVEHVIVKNACPSRQQSKHARVESTQPKILDSFTKLVPRKEPTSIVNELFQNNIGTKSTAHCLNDSLICRLDTHVGGQHKHIDDEKENNDSSGEITPVKQKVTIMQKKMNKKFDHDLEVYQQSFEKEDHNNISTQSLSSESNSENEGDVDEKANEIPSTLNTTKAYEYFASKRNSKKVNFSLRELEKRLEHDESRKRIDENDHNSSGSVKFKPKNLLRKDAESELDRFIKKDDFLHMDILGQFNKGFIIAQLKQDLFIIDQHAADEIYNFEMLQRNKKIQKQRLLRPHYLELTAPQESSLLDNLIFMERLGYDVSVDDNRKVGNRIMLTCVPLSQKQNKLFDKTDIDELLFILNENDLNASSTIDESQSNGNNSMIGVDIKPSSLRAIHASKACRKAVMIGDSLNKKEMTRIVHHLSELDKPWNCPHGRPTLRHLFCLDIYKQ